MSIKKFTFQTFPFDLTKDVVIVGDGPSLDRWIFDPDKINLFCINHSIRGQPLCRNVGTLDVHENLIENHIKKVAPGRDVNLILTTMEELFKHKLKEGSGISLFGHIIATIYRNTNIYLVGVDMSIKKNWNAEINGWRYADFIARKRGNRIIRLCENPRLDFLPYLSILP